jgi:hypothetical protein
MRYFYRDPLAAAWMTKHFGMKLHGPITTPLGEAAQSSRPMPVWIISRIIEQQERVGANDVGRFYVSPDSLHLLEPKYKDLLVGPNTMAAMFYMDDSDKEPSKRCRIIARNGIPFMWPESEAA